MNFFGAVIFCVSISKIIFAMDAESFLGTSGRRGLAYMIPGSPDYLMALHKAVNSKDRSGVNDIIKQAPRVLSQPDKDGWTPLSKAVWLDSWDIARDIADAVPADDLKIFNPEEEYPLCALVGKLGVNRKSDLELIEKLIEKMPAADLGILNGNLGRTVLSVATFYQLSKIVYLLAVKMAAEDLPKGNFLGQCSLSLALDWARAPYYDFSSHKKEMNSALLILVKRYPLKHLIELKKDNRTLLDWAKKYEQFNVLEVLEKRKQQQELCFSLWLMMMQRARLKVVNVATKST